MNRRILGVAFIAVPLVAILIYLFTPASDRSEPPVVADAAPTRPPRPFATLHPLRESRGAPAPLEAEPPKRPRPPREPGYDAKAVQTVRGRVASSNGPTRRMTNRITLQTANETLAVKLAPPRFLESLGLKLAPGDEVEVTGSRIARPGRNVIIAATVSKGGRSFTLRDDSGRPAWGGGPGSPDDPDTGAETDR